MAKDLNKVMLTGRLGKDVEVRSLQDGTLVATFTVASNRPIKDGDNWRDETEWFRVVAWRDLAERAERQLAKGKRVLIEGRLQTREWTDKNNQKQRTTEVIASDIIALDPRQQQEAASEDDWGTPSTPARRNNGRSAVADFEDDSMAPDDIPF